VSPGETVVEQDLFPVPLAVMQPGTAAPVDLYLLSQNPRRVTLYKKAGAHLREEVRERLMANHVGELHLHKKDEKAYQDYVEENIDTIIRDDLLPPEQASRLVYDSSSRVMEDTFANPRSGRNVQRAQAMVGATVQSIMKDPNALWHMTDMATHDYYTYTHCVHVCVFLVAGARELLGIEDKRALERIGLGGMLHDIGKSQIPEEILNKPARLTPEEFDEVKRHPLAGVDIVKDRKGVPRQSLKVIRSHHEHFDGSGYPDALGREGIDAVSRLATIVDVYDALTTKRSYADARSSYEALQLMLNQMAPQFDVGLLRRFVKFLGPGELRAELRAQCEAGAAAQPGEVAQAAAGSGA
jgi:HD-GYP domain-containing protein (c-di-GMP phosphodiesterase class II)